MMKKYALYLVSYLVLSLTACSQEIYVDKNEGSKIAIANGYSGTYKDCNVFACKSKVMMSKYGEKINAKPFEVNLPRDIKYFRINNQEQFEFYYANKQVVYIYVDLESKNTKADTTYNPLLEEVYNLTNHDEYSRSDTSKYLLQRISYNKRRKTTILRK